MTGFGKARCELAGKTLTIELRSLNSRQMDLNIKLPAVYREKETPLRNEITARLVRGKADLVIYSDGRGTDTLPRINREAVKEYMEQLDRMGREFGAVAPDTFEMMKLAIRMPDTLVNESPEPDETDWETIYNSVQAAIDSLDQYRIQEGGTLKSDLEGRVLSIEQSLFSISQFEENRISNIRRKLQQNLQEFLNSNTVDRNRFEQEIIYYLEKLDITEEKVRLTSHIDYFRETLEAETAQGKKLGFISQEMGREINTIGSKANDFNIQKLVVQMKDELEKIKEQTLNIL
jgi:uncharacterized protein (TIGR00255 family)